MLPPRLLQKRSHAWQSRCCLHGLLWKVTDLARTPIPVPPPLACSAVTCVMHMHYKLTSLLPAVHGYAEKWEHV